MNYAFSFTILVLNAIFISLILIIVLNTVFISLILIIVVHQFLANLFINNCNIALKVV